MGGALLPHTLRHRLLGVPPSPARDLQGGQGGKERSSGARDPHLCPPPGSPQGLQKPLSLLQTHPRNERGTGPCREGVWAGGRPWGEAVAPLTLCPGKGSCYAAAWVLCPLSSCSLRSPHSPSSLRRTPLPLPLPLPPSVLVLTTCGDSCLCAWCPPDSRSVTHPWSLGVCGGRTESHPSIDPTPSSCRALSAPGT